MDMTKALARRLTTEQAHLQDQLRGELKHGIVMFQRAQEALESGQVLDEHLLQNMMQIMSHIARHNSLLQILPYLTETASE